MVVTSSGRTRNHLIRWLQVGSSNKRLPVDVRLSDNSRIDVRLRDEWPTEAHIRHLEMIQSIVTRMATNSFLAKGWALTVAVAVYGFAIAHLNPWVCLAGVFSSLGFWWLDAFYLRAERCFRCLYNAACKSGSTVEIFSLNISEYKSKENISWWNVFFSVTLLIFYGLLVVVGVGFIIASVHHDISPKVVRIESHAVL
jgi:hypothetical protein